MITLELPLVPTVLPPTTELAFRLNSTVTVPLPTKAMKFLETVTCSALYVPAAMSMICGAEAVPAGAAFKHACRSWKCVASVVPVGLTKYVENKCVLREAR